MKIKNLNYAYNNLGIIIPKNKSVKNEMYFLDPTLKTELTFAQGNEREYFRRAKNNVNNIYHTPDDIDYKYSAEHLNEIREIVYKKSFYDEKIKQTIKCYKAKEEVYFKEIGMRPDIVFYNEDDSILCIIEIFNTHKKSHQDIKKLKQLNTVIYEISIHNTRTTNILALPTNIENEIERVAKTRSLLKEQYKQTENRIENGNIELSEVQRKINTVTRENQTIEEYTNNINSEKPSESEIYKRIRNKYRTNNKHRVHLYKRKIKNQRKQEVENNYEINSIENKIESIENEHIEYQNIEKGINRNKLQCSNLETEFNEIAKTKNVKDYCNSWMETDHLNKKEQTELIKYYCK